MVHLTYNAIERWKMPSTFKIGLYVQYHSETPCKVCPKQFAAYPERRNRADRKQLDRILNSRNRYRPNQPGTIIPNRSSLSRSARPNFYCSPVRGVCSLFTAPLFIMPEVGFLRFFSAELRQITIMRNY